MKLTVTLIAFAILGTLIREGTTKPVDHLYRAVSEETQRMGVRAEDAQARLSVACVNNHCTTSQNGIACVNNKCVTFKK
uniref:Putative conserved secreted protein n=1 Tax=Rhipicephalus microplus TaxID=6941 RepID=A0A034WWJ2_RHIMP